MAAAAIKQGNWFVADRCFRKVSEDSFGPDQNYLMLKLNILKANSDMNSLENKRTAAAQRLTENLEILDTWRTEQPTLFAKPADSVRFTLMRSKVYETLMEYLDGDYADEIFNTLSKNESFMSHIGREFFKDKDLLKKGLLKRNYER